MTDPRIAVLAAISSPDWHPVPEAHGMPWGEAEQLLAAYDASRAAAPSAPADADLPAPGESYRHYKGGLYTVDALAEDTGTGVQTVVYHDEQQHHWLRPLSEFTGTVAGVQRFILEGVLAGRERNPADADLRNRVARALAEVTVGHRAFITVDVQAEYPRADAVLAALPAPADRAAVLQVWPLARVLADVRCGSRDWTWDEEWKDLDRRHAETGYLAKLEQEIHENGITTPVLIGSDGRLWDGHHRLRIAVRRGIGYVPVEISPSRMADEAQQGGQP